MKLAEYLEKNNITQAEMANLLGISQQAIDKYINKGTVPRKLVMNRLVELTGNKVKAQDFYA